MAYSCVLFLAAAGPAGAPALTGMRDRTRRFDFFRFVDIGLQRLSKIILRLDAQVDGVVLAFE